MLRLNSGSTNLSVLGGDSVGHPSWTLMRYGQYKQVALRHQAKLVTRGAHHRFGRVNIIADKEKDNVSIDN